MLKIAKGRIHTWQFLGSAVYDRSSYCKFEPSQLDLGHC